MCNINKRINQLHRELDKYLEEAILEDCEKISEMYFELYRPKMDRVSEIIEEIYEVPKMTTDEYDVYFYEYVDIITEVQGSNRMNVINDICNKLYYESCKEKLNYIIHFFGNAFSHMKGASKGITKNRLVIEIRKADYRFRENIKRFHIMKIQEIEQELLAVMFFGQESLLDYGRRCVDGFFDDEEVEIEIEVVDYEESNKYIKMTDFDQVVCWLESQGYKLVRVAGSHHIYKNGSHAVPVPLHKGKDFNKFLGYQIQREVLKGVAC